MHEYLPTIEKSLARRQLLINQRLSRACIVHLVINKTNRVSIQIPRFGKVLKQVVKKSGARNNKNWN
jgi:hypothetical protein